MPTMPGAGLGPMVQFWGGLGQQLGGDAEQAYTAYRQTAQHKADLLENEAARHMMAYRQDSDPQHLQAVQDLANEHSSIMQQLYGANFPTIAPPAAPPLQQQDVPTGSSHAAAPLAGLAPAAADFANGGVAPMGDFGMGSPVGNAVGAGLDPKGILGQHLAAPAPAQPGPGLDPAAAATGVGHMAPEPSWSNATPAQVNALQAQVMGAPEMMTVPYGGSVVRKDTGQPVFQDPSRYVLGEDRIASGERNVDTRIQGQKDVQGMKGAQAMQALQERNTVTMAIARMKTDASWSRLITKIQTPKAISPIERQVLIEKMARDAAGGRPTQMDLTGADFDARRQRYEKEFERQLPLTPQPQGGTPTGAGPFPQGTAP